MRNVNPNLYPKGGHYFIEKDGAKIFGDTWAGVAARVVNYRKRAGYPPGNPTAEVNEQACQRHPEICAEENAAYKQAVTRVTLKTRVLQWLTGIQQSKEPLTLSFTEVATERANICAGCPKNKALPDGCASCRAAVNEMRRSIIGSRPVDSRTHACEVTGEDIPASSWIEQQRIEHSDLPGHCWRKRQV